MSNKRLKKQYEDTIQGLECDNKLIGPSRITLYKTIVKYTQLFCTLDVYTWGPEPKIVYNSDKYMIEKVSDFSRNILYKVHFKRKNNKFLNNDFMQNIQNEIDRYNGVINSWKL